MSINIVAGHTPNELRYYGDSLPHDERYERTDEFHAICRAFWARSEAEEVDFVGRHYRIDRGRLNTPFLSPKRNSPEIFLGGNSKQAADLAIRHADCLWRFPDAPERLAAEIEPVLAAGKEVGLLVALVARPTRDEALEAARAMVAGFGEDARNANRLFAQNTDSKAFTNSFRLANETSSEWVTPYLWTGAVPYLGAAVDRPGRRAARHRDGSPRIQGTKGTGTQFLFLGWPDDEKCVLRAGESCPSSGSVTNSGASAATSRRWAVRDDGTHLPLAHAPGRRAIRN